MGFRGAGHRPTRQGFVRGGPDQPADLEPLCLRLKQSLGDDGSSGTGPEIEAFCATNPIVCIIANIFFGLF